MGKATGDFLRQAREKANLSQGRLAGELGLKSAQYISNIERGIAPLPRNMIPKLARLLSVKAEDFVDIIIEELREKYLKAIGIAAVADGHVPALAKATKSTLKSADGAE